MSLSLSFVAEPHILLILVAVAFIAGFIDAIAGGGGLLTIPALLMAGLPPHLVLGTNKLCATFGSATASLAFYRKGLFNPKQWRRGLFATGIGAVLGALLAQQLPRNGLIKCCRWWYLLVRCTYYLAAHRKSAKTANLLSKPVANGHKV